MARYRTDMNSIYISPRAQEALDPIAQCPLTTVVAPMGYGKTTAVRIIPVEGADVGDTVEMGGLLGSAPLMPVHEASSADFIARGGRIPAPLQSLKN